MTMRYTLKQVQSKIPYQITKTSKGYEVYDTHSFRNPMRRTFTTLLSLVEAYDRSELLEPGTFENTQETTEVSNTETTEATLVDVITAALNSDNYKQLQASYKLAKAAGYSMEGIKGNAPKADLVNALHEVLVHETRVIQKLEQQPTQVEPEQPTRQQMVTELCKYYQISEDEYAHYNDLDVAKSYRIAKTNTDWSTQQPTQVEPESATEVSSELEYPSKLEIRRDTMGQLYYIQPDGHASLSYRTYGNLKCAILKHEPWIEKHLPVNNEFRQWLYAADAANIGDRSYPDLSQDNTQVSEVASEVSSEYEDSGILEDLDIPYEMIPWDADLPKGYIRLDKPTNEHESYYDDSKEQRAHLSKAYGFNGSYTLKLAPRRVNRRASRFMSYLVAA